MKLLVGLGNPGPKYAAHRHNVGFMAVDAIAEARNLGPWRGRFHGRLAEGALDGEPVLLLKPMTYMNESGRAVGELKRFYKLDPADVVVFHDELDLPPGKLRVKTGGGHAGHNGLRSVAAHIGADFVRVRIGIGHPGDKNRVHGYVLHDFAKAELPALAGLLDAIADASPHLAHGRADSFMNAVSLRIQGEDAAAAGRAAGARGAKPAANASKATKATKPARPVKSTSPSQRDLARAGASRRHDRPEARTPTEAEAAPSQPAQAEGPLAALLRRWLGRQ